MVHLVRGKKMKKIILFFMGIFLISLVYAITDGCASEVERATACVIRTPPITCSTADIFNASNEITHDDLTMEEIVTGTGVYNFTFNANGTGIHSIILCDNTSAIINVETTDETDLATILSNQATLQNNIETINQTIKDINASILSNISQSSFSSTVSTADQIAIGLQCAVQTLGANVTTRFYYNKTDFSVVNITYNYTGIDIFVNETFSYDNESYLNETVRERHNG